MPAPDPIAFTIFHIDIMWYAILICGGIVAAAFLCCRRAPAHGLTSDQILNFALICIPAGITGARLYYVLFHWSWYAGDFFRIINIRGGGLAIHGGLIAGLSTAALLCWIWNIHPLNLLDLAAPSIAFAQSVGRWGNYFNAEAHGGPTDLPWAITVDGQSVHPTFLYESIWCFLLFLFLLWMDSRYRSFEGRTFLLYGMLYSLERFFVEALRTDSLMIGPFKQAPLITPDILIVCAAAYVIPQRRHRSGQSGPSNSEQR
ncbi:MAG: prolipoprotein diacylglyceryl transferase [Bacillota bacterium]|nr:prolipoprotein diacylglyceryl transferase [Bacillota bacterium]